MWNEQESLDNFVAGSDIRRNILQVHSHMLIETYLIQNIHWTFGERFSAIFNH